MPNEKVVPIKASGLAVARAFSAMATRMGWGRLTSFGGRRDYNKIFGWDEILTNENMRTMYNRGGIAKRVVDSYPDAIWARPPQLWVEGQDDWVTTFNKFAQDLNLWSALYRLDKLAGLGRYAILLIGTDKGSLETPLQPNAKIIYLQPYGEDSAKITEFDRNPLSTNFGRPLFYQINPAGSTFTTANGLESTEKGPSISSFRVHYTRVLHVAQDNLEDEIYGVPRMAPVWDYLTDLRKVVGASSESYWIMANRGLQADVDKDMELGQEDAAALSEEIQEFYDGFRRFIRTKGVKMNELEGTVADPTGPFNTLVTLIAGARGIPKRILLGSEAGQLASSQDKGNWAERVEENRALYIEPNILRPFLAKLLSMKVLPVPLDTVNALWPDAYRMSPLERGQTAAQTARSLANVMKAMGRVELQPETVVQNADGTTATTPAKYAAPIITREEARAIIGLSTDNRVLATDPDV